MPIRVTCPGCHKRFEVADKFAGKKGPCPKCKTKITIPEKDEEVVVHEQDTGPKDKEGRSVLKPIAREEAKFSPVWAVVIGVAALAVVGAAWYLRGQEEKSPVLLGLGAAILGPALALAGYSFLRNDELEPYRGRELLVRAVICGLVYAALWGVYELVVALLFQGDRPEIFALLYLLPPIVLAGALAAYASLDLEFGSAMVHYGMYLAATVGLRALMNIDLF